MDGDDLSGISDYSSVMPVEVSKAAWAGTESKGAVLLTTWALF